MGVLHQQTRQGHDGCQNASAQDGARNQRTHRHVALHHQQRTHHHQAGIAHLLQHDRQVAHILCGTAHAQVALNGHLVVVDPAGQELPAARTGLDGLNAFYRLDQQTGAHIRQGGTFSGQVFDLGANSEPQEQSHAAKHQRHQRHQRAGDQCNDHQKQQTHGQVDQGEQGVGRVKTAHLFIPPQLPCQTADRAGYLVHAQAEQLLEHFTRETVVNPCNHIIHQMGSGQFHGVFNQDAEQHARAEHYQGVFTARRNHTVIDLH